MVKNESLKFRLVKAVVYPVVIYGCESWTVKKAELWRIDAFELWCWRRLLRAPWTARRSNQSILKEISPGHSLEGMMLKLKLHAKSWLIGKDSDAGSSLGQEEKGMTEDEMAGWHYWLDEHEFGWTLGVGDGQGGLACCGSWDHKESDMTERLNWTELMDSSLPGSSVHRIFQARILEWVAIPFSSLIYSSVYMSIPVSQFIPPPTFLPPYPLVSHNFVFYICDSNNNYFYGSDTHTSMCQVLL